jgi:predicted enzyme related to lactoylglutathione lyase
MGGMGTYQIFSTKGQQSGGMMKKMDQEPVAHWLYYISVDAIDAAQERVKSAGGQVIHGPMEVPGGAWIINGLDPQGAVFALVAPKR